MCAEGDVPLSNDTTIKAKQTTYGEAKKQAVAAMKKAFPESGCSDDCLEAQLDAYHKQCGIDDNTVIKAVETGQTNVSAAEQAVIARSKKNTSINSNQIQTIGKSCQKLGQTAIRL